jgi:hypothetical protein
VRHGHRRGVGARGLLRLPQATAAGGAEPVQHDRLQPSRHELHRVKENIFAYTDVSGVSCPGYVSINRLANGDVEVSVRSAPRQRDGIYVCSHRPGPGNCTAGGPTCNNYCNMAPEKGPMQDRPMPCRHTDEGSFASFVIPADQWDRLRSQV